MNNGGVCRQVGELDGDRTSPKSRNRRGDDVLETFAPTGTGNESFNLRDSIEGVGARDNSPDQEFCPGSRLTVFEA